MRRNRSSIVAVIVIALLSTAVAAGATVSPSSDEAKRAHDLVSRLGDESFAVREAASAALFRLGLAAKPYLLVGARHDDPEVRRRCGELLPAVLAADLEARITAFLIDKDGRRQTDLPGWARFRKLVGDDPAARLLFSEIVKCEAGSFVAQADARPDTAGDILAGRCQALQLQMHNPATGAPRPLAVADVAALLFVASDNRVQVPLQAVYSLNNFFYQPSIRAAIGTAATASPFKRLLVAWISGQTDPNVVQQTLYLAMNLELKESLGLALKVARDKAIRGHPRGLALTAIGKLGSKEHMPLLQEFLDDGTLIGNLNINRVQGTTEVRDVALGMLVHLSGQAHGDYGFAFVPMNVHQKFNPWYLGFTSPDKRQTALKKWKDYAASARK